MREITLAELADNFKQRERDALQAEKAARTQCQKNTFKGVAGAWREAAEILIGTHFQNVAAARIAAASIPQEG